MPGFPEDIHDRDDRTDRDHRTPARPFPAREVSGLAAAARARAVVPARAGFRLWLQPLDPVSVVHEFEGIPEHQPHRVHQLPETLGLDLRDRSAVELVHGTRQHGPVRRALYLLLPLPWSRAGNPARPEDPRRRNLAADLSLPARAVFHRDRHGLEIVSRPAHRPRKGGARLGLDELSL